MSSIFLKKTLKFADFFIFFAFLVIFLLFFSMILQDDKNSVLFISANGQNYEYDLSVNRKIYIEGAIGKTEFCIENKNVFITNSVCKNKICEHQGKINKNGQWLSCAPNKVFAIINSKSNKKTDNKIDATSF